MQRRCIFFVRCLIAKVWTLSGSKSLAYFSSVSKTKLFSQKNYNSWVVDLCFDDLDGLNTLKHCEKCSETWNLGPWFSSYGQKPFHGHACQFGNILGIQEPLTSKLLRIWGCSLLPWIKHHKTMWFQPKNKLCPKPPKICWFGAKMGLAHSFTRNDILSYVSTFYGFWTSK